MFEIDKKKFGIFVAELRKKKGYTQKELSERLFVSDKAVSKWETGMSIPDPALLIPLADLLGVSVTELLMCERTEQEAMNADQVENMIKTAISYSEGAPARAYQSRGKWAMIYLLSVVTGGIALLLNHLQGQITEMTLVAVILGAVFGAYFCFFARTRLPAYYDENRIGGVHDGPFRMNVPGVTFNNTNWPYIILVGRVWSCLATAVYPLLAALMTSLFADAWLNIERCIYLPLVLGGLFIPMYVVGRKYQ